MKIINKTGLTLDQWNDRFPNFPMIEVACPCCGVVKINLIFMDKLQSARTDSEIPFSLSSACRCRKHNASKGVGGKEDSRHIFDDERDTDAVDVRTPNSVTRGKVLYYLNKAGITYTGINKAIKFVHGDGRKMILNYLY